MYMYAFPAVCAQTGSSLELLNVSHCPLGEEGMLALCRVLQHCRHLQELGLADVGLTVESVHPLCRYILYMYMYMYHTRDFIQRGAPGISPPEF